MVEPQCEISWILITRFTTVCGYSCSGYSLLILWHIHIYLYWWGPYLWTNHCHYLSLDKTTFWHYWWRGSIRFPFSFHQHISHHCSKQSESISRGLPRASENQEQAAESRATRLPLSLERRAGLCLPRPSNRGPVAQSWVGPLGSISEGVLTYWRLSCILHVFLASID